MQPKFVIFLSLGMISVTGARGAAIGREFAKEQTPSSLPVLEYPTSLGHFDFSNSHDGTYFFQYDSGISGEEGPASFRGESRSHDGVVTGYFGYVDPDGILRVTNYKADINGYRSSTTLRYLRGQSKPN